jgi:hypothetical protein
VLSGAEPDRSKLKTIIVGHYALKEFEESDPEFANALYAAQNIPTQMSKGLNISR